MTHYRTQATGIKPTDTVAFLTGRLADGTQFVGMDSISVKGSTSTRPSNIGSASPKFFVADPSADNVYRYTSAGGTTGFVPTDSLVKDVRGIVSDAAGDTLWQVDAASRAIVVQGPTGALRWG